ncbi:EexN family lipoprotein [Pantoea agglomerans]|uniref:EexN family lipoprotein n=1 Tax=Enterobacter agglomerans TaxID=549 RepID=UPI003C79F40B
MKTGLLSLVLLATTLLTGCDAGAKGIDWFKAHDAERQAKYEECTKASDDPRGTEDCRNAIDATVHSGSFTKSPDKSW